MPVPELQWPVGGSELAKLVTFTLPSAMLVIRYFVAANGRSPFADWFAELDGIARARVTRAITRLEQGNFGNVKAIGAGVLESKIDFGPGYRVYFGRDGDALVILLCGGTKRRQHRDIDAAYQYWHDYKEAKRER